jgi:decaprenyl-phosphate phosphoribosyltransferase
MGAFAATVVVMGLLLFIRMPLLENFFTPTLPVASGAAAVTE